MRVRAIGPVQCRRCPVELFDSSTVAIVARRQVMPGRTVSAGFLC